MRQLRTMPAVPAAGRKRLEVQGQQATGVDRANKQIRGYVVAQEGPFKSEGRGEFDQASLDAIIKLWPKSGLKSRFGHPTESSDSLGKFVGRAHNPRLSLTATGLSCVRADLHIDKSCYISPEGDLGSYLLTLAESDPGAFASSLVLSRTEEYRLNPNGSRKCDSAGFELPPLWRPTKLFASDLVDEGDAVDAFLDSRFPASILARATKLLDHLADDQVEAVASSWLASYLEGGHGLPEEVQKLLNSILAGQERATVETRARSWLSRYLTRRVAHPSVLRRKLALKAKAWKTPPK